jgi:hypothetical protein
MLELRRKAMTRSKLPTAKSRKVSESAKSDESAKTKARKPGDIELSEEALSKITGGLHTRGNDTVF